MVKLTVLILALLSVSPIFGQDERFFRQLFSRKLEDSEKLQKNYKWRVQTPYYEFDLDRDGVKEGIVYEKKDGEDFINIHSSEKKIVGSYFMPAQGPGAQLYRILIRKLSSKTRVLVLYFYEGYVQYLRFYGSVRLYFLTIDNNDLSTLSFSKGPRYYYESLEFKQRTYFQHTYELSLVDLDGDGVKEVETKYQNASYVFRYKGDGKWVGL